MNLLEGQSGVNMFSLEVGAEDCQKKKKKYKAINTSMFILSVQLSYYLINLLIKDTTLFQRLGHKTALRVYHALSTTYTKPVLEKFS